MRFAIKCLDLAICDFTFFKHCFLKGPSQPPPFSMPSKLFTLHGEAKSYCISLSCVPEGMFDYL